MSIITIVEEVFVKFHQYPRYCHNHYCIPWGNLAHHVLFFFVSAPTTVRLVFSRTQGLGRLEIFHYTAGWLLVCVDGFDPSAAMAACHSLHYG